MGGVGKEMARWVWVTINSSCKGRASRLRDGGRDPSRPCGCSSAQVLGLQAGVRPRCPHRSNILTSGFALTPRRGRPGPSWQARPLQPRVLREPPPTHHTRTKCHCVTWWEAEPGPAVSSHSALIKVGGLLKRSLRKIVHWPGPCH